MSEIDYDKLAASLTPMHENALWSTKDIANYLRRSTSFVYASVTNQPTFPDAIRIGESHPLWRARDVMAWVESQNIKMGRPRKSA